ncbi:MAG: hypothetical protein IIB44_07025 [Candidatus Marinimicrobia bacterium]|nr:hypothetical protein [Candidatus Neomarinimicrobiota bacterium]
MQAGIPPDSKRGRDNFLNWDETHGYITFRSGIFQLEFSRQPFIWGSFNDHSLVFSNNSAAFPLLSVQTHYRKFHYQFLHGMIMSVVDSVQSASGIEVRQNKYIVAHRIELFPIKYLSLVYSEMIIYGRESPELGYMLPVMWFKPLQHNLADRDNLLISLEGKLTLPAFGQVYGTLLFDEFVRSKLFENWWGNKFGFQFGMRFPWKIFHRPNLFLVEFTAIRPWVYTHKLDVNTFTHNMRGLGFPYGPNSQVTHIVNRFMPNERWVIQLKFTQLKHGEPRTDDDYPIGSNPNDNYNDRNQEDDDVTYFLMGDITTTNTIKINVDYRLSNTIWAWCAVETIESKSEDHTIIHIGVRFDY